MRLFVDFNSSGHHPRHIEHVLNLSGGVMLTSEKALDRVSRKTVNESKLRIVAIRVATEDFTAHVKTILAFIKSNPDITSCVHLALDDIFVALLKAISINPPTIAISGVWMSCNAFYTQTLGLKQWWKFKLLTWSWIYYVSVCNRRTSGVRILFLNEELTGWARKKLHGGKLWASWIPDPIDEVSCVSEAANDGVSTIAFLGVHNARKGTVWALEALRYWKGPKMRVVIAGEWRDKAGLRDAIGGLPNSIDCVLWDRTVTTHEWVTIVKRSSVVCAPYHRFGGSSGIVANALAAKRKVLVSNFGLLGKRVSQLSSAMVFEHANSREFLAKLESLLDCTLDDTAFQKASKWHSISGYKRRLAEHYVR